MLSDSRSKSSYNADLMVGFFLLLVTGALNSHIARKYVTLYAFIQGCCVRKIMQMRRSDNRLIPDFRSRRTETVIQTLPPGGMLLSANRWQKVFGAIVTFP